MTAAITATYQGHVASTQDALIIIEGCLRGYINHVSRRPRQAEQPALPRSGNIFVYEQRSSGITVWQDGKPWSEPARVGNFEMRCMLASPTGHSRVNGGVFLFPSCFFLPLFPSLPVSFFSIFL